MRTVAENIIDIWKGRQGSWVRPYATVAAFMVLGAIFIWVWPRFAEHRVAVLEAYELFFFAVYWVVQTKEHWREQVEPS